MTDALLLCTRCARRPPCPGGRLCARCRKVGATCEHHRQLVNVAAGRCRACGKRRPAEGRAYCERCLKAKRVASARYYQRNRAKKLAYMRARAQKGQGETDGLSLHVHHD